VSVLPLLKLAFANALAPVCSLAPEFVHCALVDASIVSVETVIDVVPTAFAGPGSAPIEITPAAVVATTAARNRLSRIVPFYGWGIVHSGSIRSESVSGRAVHRSALGRS
jgi:hypothetical protein